MNKLNHKQTSESPKRKNNKDSVPTHPDLKRIYDLCLNNKKYNWDDFVL
jgi:hypothetical protein